ncbi:MAG: SEL1-like repeat protein [Alphaproteobacteria bacterium]|nr:SEL1-like repeat protein [Alphaproteobacteria bacterium]
MIMPLLALGVRVNADIAQANAANQAGDYNVALAQYHALAKTGNPEAQYQLGLAYQQGRGVTADLQQALDWYHRAATHTPPYPQAQNAYALALFQSGQRAKAIPLLELAAQRGDPRAQFVLGTAYFNGDVVGKDNVKAYAYMTRSANSGVVAQASSALATMDNYIPADQRDAGRALARQMDVAAQQVQLAQIAPGGDINAPQPLESTPLPPSIATGAVYTPPPAEVENITPDQQGWSARPRLVRPLPRHPAAQPKPAPPLADNHAAAGSASTRSAPSGAWRIQLGAFGDEAKAREQGEALLGRVPALNPYTFFLVHAAKVVRLQAGPLTSRETAAQLCGAVKAKGVACLVVNP